VSRRYHILDVFTDRPLAGNPLAVVTEADGLDQARMQSIAREFNLSETVFVLPPNESRHRARVRIFTPTAELPFAGHPTVGAAVLLSMLDGHTTAAAFGLEEAVGVVPCVTEPRGDRAAYARFRLPKLPVAVGAGVKVGEAAAALGLRDEDIGFGRHGPSLRQVGPPFHLIPLASLDALGRSRPSGAFDTVLAGAGARPAAFLYARSGDGFRARMFAPSMGVYEDPATGSAVACLAGAIAEYEGLGDGTWDFSIDQGVEMGRPSRIDLQIVLERGALVSGEIGGGAVLVAEGQLHA
jgi:trans-2,3-dihydro-3-hydroxyanthranilate isomerase